MNVLFMCVANSARSQMAEGLAREILGSCVRVESAGSLPTKVNPYAIQVLAEIGIDIRKHHSKCYDDLPLSFLASLDYVITLCAEEVCPTMVSKGKRIHWPFPDPAGKAGTVEEELSRFRETRQGIRAKLEEFAAQNL